MITVTLSADTVETLLICTDDSATDELEPSRYREGYAAAAAELRAAAGIPDGRTTRPTDPNGEPTP